MSNNIFDVLEVCLQELDKGVELEAILARYADLAEELRPLLQAARVSKQASVPEPATNVLLRNQAKVLQRFDQVWDAKPVRRSWFPAVQQRRLVAFVLLVVVFFFSGTNLVRASFDALPGDGLYPVKRSWERTTLFFTFDAQAREKLALQYDRERLNELDQLFASGRTAHVEFSGVVTLQEEGEWQVAAIPVMISAQTELSNQAIQEGDWVRVFGTTRGDGVVFAERVALISVGTPVPTPIETRPALETATATPQPGLDNAGSESESETPATEEPEIATPTLTPQITSFVGTLIAMDQNIWKIDAIVVEVGHAEIVGVPVIGVTVMAEGYFNADGSFVASRLVIINNGLNDNSVNSNNDDGGSNIDDDDTNTNDNGGGGNDDSGGGNSGNGSNDNGG